MIGIEDFEYVSQFPGTMTMSNGVVSHWQMLHVDSLPASHLDYFMTEANYYPGRE